MIKITHLLIGVVLACTGATARARPMTPSKSEGESLHASFIESGHVGRGERSYTTMGMPARMSEDRHRGLLPADTAKVERLARAVLKRCGR